MIDGILCMMEMFFLMLLFSDLLDKVFPENEFESNE